MPIDCACPHCDRSFKVKDHLAGRKTYCPGCKKMFRIPAMAAGVDPGTEQLVPLGEEDAVAEFDASDAADDGTAEEPLQVECPLCKGRMPFEVKLQGVVVVCPHCRGQFRVPKM